MGYFRFRRSFKLLPGVRWNMGKRSSSISLGGKGFHYTIGSVGTRTTVGIPGTGLSYTSVGQRMKAERIPDHAVERAMEWSKAQEETFHVKFPDREAGEPAASPEQLHAIHELVRSISGSDLAHLGTKQAAYLIDEITHEKARFTERKVHEYLDRQTRSSSTGCLLLFLLLAGIVYVMIHSAH